MNINHEAVAWLEEQFDYAPWEIVESYENDNQRCQPMIGLKSDHEFSYDLCTFECEETKGWGFW